MSTEEGVNSCQAGGGPLHRVVGRRETFTKLIPCEGGEEGVLEVSVGSPLKYIASCHSQGGAVGKVTWMMTPIKFRKPNAVPKNLMLPGGPKTKRKAATKKGAAKCTTP